MRVVFLLRFHSCRDPCALNLTEIANLTPVAILPRPPQYMRNSCQFLRKIYLFKINGLGVFGEIGRVLTVIFAYRGALSAVKFLPLPGVGGPGVGAGVVPTAAPAVVWAGLTKS